MIQEYQLRLLPEIAANEQRLKEYLSKRKRIKFKEYYRYTYSETKY